MAMFDDLSKMLEGANIDLKDIEKMAQSAGIDAGKGADILNMLGSNGINEKSISNIASGMDPAQLGAIGQMLGNLDLKNLDVEAIAKQFGIPSEMVGQVMSMIKK